MEFSWETLALEEIKDDAPIDRVKRFLNVKLKNKNDSLSFVEPPSIVPHAHEISVDASFLDESALDVGDKGIHVRARRTERTFAINLAIE